MTTEKEIMFCYECGYQGKCVIEDAWNVLAFEYGECDDDCHFLKKPVETKLVSSLINSLYR